MPNWLGPLLALVLLAGFIGYAFRQSSGGKRSGDSGEPWTGGDGSTGGDGHSGH